MAETKTKAKKKEKTKGSAQSGTAPKARPPSDSQRDVSRKGAGSPNPSPKKISQAKKAQTNAKASSVPKAAKSQSGGKAAAKGKNPAKHREEGAGTRKKEERKRQKEEQARRAANRQELEKQLAAEDSKAYENLLRRRSAWKKKKRKQAYGFLLVILAAAGLYLCCRMFLTISTIEITGQSRYTDDELILSSGLKIGDNLFDFDPEQVGQKILDGHIYLESVTVRRSLPTTVEIQVSPVLETGVVKGEAGFSIISTGGKVLQTGIAYPPSELPVITGIQLNVSRADNQELANIMDKRLEILSEINRALTENKLTGITAIDLSDTMNLSITYQDRVKIGLGNKEKLQEKIGMSVKVLEEVDPSQEGVLNLSIEKKGFFREEGIHGSFAPLTSTYSPPVEPEGEGGEEGESSSQPAEIPGGGAPSASGG